MKALTSKGRQHVQDIAAKYNVRTETVESLLKAVLNGRGTMAQFDIAELGGSGQWMKGGMTMVGDMFNNSLKTKVNNLCNELSELVTRQVLYEELGDESSERHSESKLSTSNGNVSSSWPSAFGNPTSSGSQNNFRYAYFGRVSRLIIDENGKRAIYDTKHHKITGVSQQQGSGSSYKFTSQDGPVDLGSLELVSEPSAQTQPTPEIAYDVTSNADLGHGASYKSSSDHGLAEDDSSNDHTGTHYSPTDRSPTDRSPQDIIIATIEKVNVLFEKGQITEEEFKAKKQELLSRL
ncbi:SHOCT domain-containing protein [Dyadobacter sp. CY326]|uniref:SHOCT domain-containing protein n=1 Tax=Dyadobacter sp. CY326 TaxID=2907300 RepID=UPI001F2D7643|nr:SHOCT domain-containing protein [Dyadobacter sp. CY326]MCE7067973.1 SHOCT domain-containing protein [Dyadobacter sp. CY326]